MIRKSLVSALLLSTAMIGAASTADAAQNQNSRPLVPMYGNIEPFYGNIEPFYGNIEPFYGNIEPFYGNIEPFYGNIEPFYGNIEPFYGNIEPFYGNIEPFYGNIEPFYGNIEPFYGNIEPFYGNIEPFYGNIEPFYGNIEPFYGNIEPFSGNIKPLYGNIEPFYGNIEPFYGSIEPFYGNIEPFWGSITPAYGNIEPFYGNIEPFYGNIEPFYGNIEPFWRAVLGPTWFGATQAGSSVDLTKLQRELVALLAISKADYGKVIEKATGNDFMAFAQPILNKYGIDVTDAASLANVQPRAQAAFMLDWYDGLMGYSALPRVDWWMHAVNWTPAITQIQNSGTHAVIGILDSKFSNVSTNVKDLEFVGGYDYYVNDHGAEVASLIASQHTAGKVMGIAPNSPIKAYNPFDYTGTTNFDDVAAGINALYAHGASVINASMGVPGQVFDSEWSKILNSPQVNQADHPLVLVKAAGNEGVAQTTDVNWTGGSAPNNIILVGSVNMAGQISAFSNTPGNACILVNGACDEQNKLMYHFIVAPGEMILVSNNAGGVTRVNGTSFAAPLVTGAVALLQDRWPWLKQHPDATTEIIFKSAKDLGAPGVDPVYGWGELDVTASQSPLNFNNLQVMAPSTSPTVTWGQTMPAATLKSALLDPGQLALWNKQGAYIVAFETVGDTFRDFDIPLSAMLATKKLSDGTEDKPFQSYLYKRLIDWAKTPSAASFNTSASHLNKGDWSLSLTATEASPDELRKSTAPVHYEFAATNTKTGLGFRFGEGSGAHALVGVDGFSQRSDFDPETGGVNPVLGFASGGAYGRAELTLGKAKFSYGFTQKTDDHMGIDPTYGPVALSPLAPTHAFASVMSVDYEVIAGFKLNASLTKLREGEGLLGAQGGGLFEMVNGSSTDATTLSASYALPKGWSLFASATKATSAAPHFASTALSFSANNLSSTAYELVAQKTGLFEKTDLIRLSIAQPLHLEAGAIQYRSLQVVNRQTGELGSYSQNWDVSGKRELRIETLYGTSIMDGAGELDGYTLVDFNPHTSKTGATELAIGSRIHFDF